MSDIHEVKKNINKLESMLSTFFGLRTPDWKEVWAQIRKTSESFKGTKFTSGEERQELWDKFQRIVQKVKDSQAEQFNKLEDKKRDSSRFLDKILILADAAKPYDTGLGDAMLTIFTGGVNIALDMVLGPFDSEKEMLLLCSEKLKEGWAILKDNKNEMTKNDKDIAFQALKKSQDLLDYHWTEYKHKRQEAYEKYQNEKQIDHSAWVARVESNIRNNEERRDKLKGVLEHKKGHLRDLHEKYEEAWSDDYQSKVLDWIAEEEASIDDIEHKLEEIRGWIEEDQDKLRG